MRVLVLGATGMLGHKLVERFCRQFETVGTVRGRADDYAEKGVLSGSNPGSRPKKSGAVPLDHAKSGPARFRHKFQSLAGKMNFPAEGRAWVRFPT